MTPRDMIRLLIHEGQRIFGDRLVQEEEHAWTEAMFDEVCRQHLNAKDEDLKRPIYFSTYLRENYEEASREELREYIQAKLAVFNEEELNVELVIFDDALEHILRIARVLRQPLGHLLLVGASGAGKTVLSKFVSWINGLMVFQIKCGRNYDVTAFENDLRSVMKMAGIKGTKITFIFDESNALGPAFLERMNALLASGEVPGLFEGDEWNNLIQECKSGMQGLRATDENEYFAKFTKNVQRNLHIVFTMNPANPDFYNRKNSSPALFNRCIIDWFGDWPVAAQKQVAHQFTNDVFIAENSFGPPGGIKEGEDEDRHIWLSNTLVDCPLRVAETSALLPTMQY